MKHRIEMLMRSNQADNRNALAIALHLFSILFGAAVRLRTIGYRSGRLKTKRLPCKVASVGNITVGGTGKTPMTILLAEILHRHGFRPAIVSRGYKGEAEKRGGIVSDGRKFYMSAEKAGDEPWMMAGRLQKIGVPVVVGRNRYESGKLALAAFQPNVILLDDAFQHLKLWRDLDLVLLDGTHPFGNNHLLPRGVLREPVAALCRADIVILTRDTKNRPWDYDRLRNVTGDRPVYTGSHQPFISQWVTAGSPIRLLPPDAAATKALSQMQGRKVFGFSGIAGNTEFRKSLEALGCDIRAFTGFADHHQYSAADVATLQQAACRSGADIVCTTDKDYSRLIRQGPWPVDLAVLGVGMSLGSRQAEFEKDIIRHLGTSVDSTLNQDASVRGRRTRLKTVVE